MKFLYIFKNVQSTHINIRLEMENALLVQGIPAEFAEGKFSACVKIVSIAFKGRIIHIRVMVGAIYCVRLFSTNTILYVFVLQLK